MGGGAGPSDARISPVAKRVSEKLMAKLAISGGASTSVAAIGAVTVVTNDTTASARHADLEVGVASNWVRTTTGGTGIANEMTTISVQDSAA